MSGEAVLYVVATPIGNLGDMVPRAVEVLQSVGLIAAEDTRHSGKLLQHFRIDTPCVSYHDHSGESRLDELLAKLGAGVSVALISDAGTPLVSDPGYRLIERAQAAGLRVVPVPGACAAIAALSAAGLPSDRFAFEGFLPAKQAARRARLEALAGETRTLIFYEAPHRVLQAVEDMAAVLGAERLGALARELTKHFETVKRAPLGELAAWIAADDNQQRGECVLLVAGCSGEREADPDAERTLGILLEELPVKQAAALAARITGLPKNQLYQRALALKGGA